jgi:hypothetical protein
MFETYLHIQAVITMIKPADIPQQNGKHERRHNPCLVCNAYRWKVRFQKSGFSIINICKQRIRDIPNVHVSVRINYKLLPDRAGFRGGGMGPGPQASHQKGASHQTRRGLPREKISFTFKLCGGGKKSEGKQGKDGDMEIGG